MPDFPGLNSALKARKQQHLYRSRSTLQGAQGTQVIIDRKQYINFCSNDYLSLANHPEVILAMNKASADYGVGSGASHLVCGHSSIHHELEIALAQFTGRERVLLFSTGYMANLGVINALLGKQDFIFEDRLNHASLLDAGLLCGARFQRFLHNDIKNLEMRLSKAQSGRKLVVVDSVYSMDGDLAPLADLADLAERYNACLMADDAHGVGVLGQTGAGCAEHFSLSQQQLPILMGTLGKSFGSFGAFVAGSEALIETLIQHARTYIYTTALPPAIAAASLASLNIIKNEHTRRDQLQNNIALFREQVTHCLDSKNESISLMPSITAIQPLLIGDSEKALFISEALASRGLLVSAIRPPTVAEGSARLRITLNAEHTQQQIHQLVEVLDKVLQ